MLACWYGKKSNNKRRRCNNNNCTYHFLFKLMYTGNILTRHTLYVYIHKIQVLWEKRINMGKKGKGKKKKGKKPSTADSSKSNASGKGKGKKGKKKKKKKEIEPEVYEFKEPEQWAKDIGMVEFFHGEKNF